MLGDQPHQSLMKMDQPQRQFLIDGGGEHATGDKPKPIALGFYDSPPGSPKPRVDPHDSHHFQHAPSLSQRI